MPSKSLILLCIAIACELFAYWGAGTVAGRREFDISGGKTKGLLGKQEIVICEPKA